MIFYLRQSNGSDSFGLDGCRPRPYLLNHSTAFNKIISSKS
jgi:hypothetical protein